LGADLFIYIAGDGADRIVDFSAVAGDRIDLSGEHVATYAGLMACSTHSGADIVIDFGSGDTLTLQGTDWAQLGAADFIFWSRHAPTGILISNDTVLETSPIGTVVGSLSTADEDLGEAFTYSLLDDYGGLFAIDGRNLVLRGALDGTPSYDLTVHVIDGE